MADEVVNFKNHCFVEEMGDKSQSTNFLQISTMQLASEENQAVPLLEAVIQNL
jgi:hypothetical protein